MTNIDGGGGNLSMMNGTPDETKDEATDHVVGRKTIAIMKTATGDGKGADPEA
jgi:hypothetical protein